MDQNESVRFGLLGPLEVRRAGELLDPGPPQRRLLLVRLLMEEGQPISAESLCEDLWNGRPPASAMSSLHAHISRLRATLEPGRGRGAQSRVLTSDATGYILHVGPAARDTARFDEAVRRAGGLLAEGQAAPARREIEQALALWRGPALADVRGAAFAAREAARLEEARLLARELHGATLIAVGEHAAAARLAEELVGGNPLWESAWALLMRALYLSGHQAEALLRYERVRGLLADELGLDPGPELRRIRDAILDHDTGGLVPPAPGRGAARPDRTASAALPLTGRREEMHRLDGVLRTAASGRAALAVVTGAQGTGKTRLLDETVRRATAGQDFDVVRVRCHTPEAELSPLSPAAQLLRGLGIAHEGQRWQDVLRTGSRPRPAADEGASARAHTGAHPGAGAADAALPMPYEAVGALRARLAQRPVLCVVDDLHHADAGFRRLLTGLVLLCEDAPLALVCAFRPAGEEDPGSLVLTLVRQGVEWIGLEPLGEANIRDLLRWEAESASAAALAPALPRDGLERTAALLYERTGGNPFLLAEVLRLPAGRRTGPDAELPGPVRTVVGARLAALPRRVRSVLETAAVIDTGPEVETVAHASGLTIEDVLLRAQAAVDAGVVEWEQSALPSAGMFRFADGLTRDTVLAGLSPVRRQLLHAAVAKALCALGRRPAAVARHLAQAGPLVPRQRSAVARDPQSLPATVRARGTG